MKLIEYREGKGLGRADFGTLIGVSEVSVHRYEHGRVPEPAVMRRIVETTNGAVEPNDFFDGVEAPEPVAKGRAA